MKRTVGILALLVLLTLAGILITRLRALRHPLSPNRGRRLSLS